MRSIERERAELSISGNGTSTARMRPVRLLAVCALAAIGVLAGVSSASAHQFYPYEYGSYFDGHDSTGGTFTQYMNSMTIDQDNGRVFVMYQHGTNGEAEISQFDAEGHAVPFSA